MLKNITIGLLIGMLLSFPACTSPAPSTSTPPLPSASSSPSPSPSPSPVLPVTRTSSNSTEPQPVPIPAHPPFPTTVVFTKITEALTVSENQTGTRIPCGSVIYHWANGITEAYSANNSLIFIANDSEAAQLPHPSGPNGPFVSPATKILQVPSGARITNDPGDNVTIKVYLDINLILTIINEPGNYPLTPEK
jgi:hypothetical protein